MKIKLIFDDVSNPLRFDGSLCISLLEIWHSLFQIHFGLMGAKLKVPEREPGSEFQIHFGLMGAKI